MKTRCGEGAAARFRPIPPDPARFRPILPDPARSRPILARTPPERCLDRGARKRGLQPDPARSRPILARTLRNGVWTGVLANEGRSPIPPDSGTTKMVMRTPETKKNLPAAPLLAIFFSKMVMRTPETKKICQQHSCW